ncbi:MAG: 50S ribosomal protein L23 [Candidatus Pacearchaeota archaeon]|jgi:large subunit ribosomal protein L23|nr:50S ribosomal protein L23 [Candidatus Pacearchaeota archaeon]MDP7520740.1 50S ribosomal protein L23 [Candidatus Pacearchaeota archaeon]|tara:strand:+ start:1198 stop:1434 length:237 start_codon:yes stop_codon:yes gene_type:complete
MKLLATEKAVMMIESQNVLTFRTNMNKTKKEIREEIESLFDIKIEKIRTLIRGNKKYAYVKLKKEFLAIDVATKLGLM